jgi:hypothetical protein
MKQTLRSYIAGRVRWCLACAVVGWLLIPLGATLGRNLPADVPRGALPLLGFLVFGAAMVAMQWLVTCPKCRAKLGKTIAMPLAFSWGSGPKVNFCPYCGVNLDQPMAHAQGVPESQDPIK